jgi:proteic killer suppression protein
MIKSFRHAGLEKFFKTGSKAGIQPHHAAKLEEQLTALDLAQGEDEMAMLAPASWRLHSLQGKEKYWSIWVNGNWRVTFTFEGEDVILVDYRDYH